MFLSLFVRFPGLLALSVVPVTAQGPGTGGEQVEAQAVQLGKNFPKTKS